METKDKILKIIKESPIKRISVADLMNATGMSRLKSERELFLLEIEGVLKREELSRTESYTYRWWMLRDGEKDGDKRKNSC